MPVRPPTSREANWVLLASLALLLAGVVPWFATPIRATTGVDASWIAALHEGFAQHWRWGHDIIWHYGPLGFLFGGFKHPATFHTMLALYVGFTLSFWLGLRALWRHAPINPAAPIAVALLVVMTHEVLFAAFSLWAILLYHRDERRQRQPLFWLMLLAAAIAGWVKFSYLLLGLAAVLAIELHRVWTRQTPGIVLVPFTAMLLGLWLLLGQSLGDLPAYLHGAWELGRGFAAIATTNNPWYYAALYGVVGASWIAALCCSMARSNKAQALTLAAGLLLQLALMTKAEFLNDNDYHFMQALAWFFLLALISKDCFWPPRRTLLVPLVASAAVALVLVVPDYVRRSAPEVEGYVASVHLLLGEKNASPHVVTSAANPVATHRPTDVYTQSLMALLSQPEASYRPRPVIQSYHTYTPHLAQLNREALLRDHAAQEIWFAPEPVHGTYPTLEDAPSWPELLARYHVREQRGAFAVLARNATPRSYRLTALGEAQHAPFGEWVAVPKARSRIIWATIGYRPSVLSRALVTLYRLPPTRMEVRLADGTVHTFRTIPEIMGGGFILSPYIANAADFTALYAAAEGRTAPYNPVVAIRFPRPADGWCRGCLFEDSLMLRFEAFSL